MNTVDQKNLSLDELDQVSGGFFFGCFPKISIPVPVICKPVTPSYCKPAKYYWKKRC